ncbi:MAG: hypothetical protein NT062_07700 [Proteobacteria bacterium]|nr:hypothetical protein [Pseudomonadota bacterium]
MTKLAPITNVPLERDCVRLRTDRSLALGILGGVILVFTGLPLFAWLPDARWPSDLNLLALGACGLAGGLLLVIRAATGPWSRTDLPRVQIVTGLLHVREDGRHVAYPLDQLGEVTTAWTDERVNRTTLRTYALHVEHLAGPLATSTNRERINERWVRLNGAIVASRVRPILLAPDVDDGAFRQADPIAMARQLLMATTWGYIGCGMLLRDPEPIVRQRALTLMTRELLRNQPARAA